MKAKNYIKIFMIIAGGGIFIFGLLIFLLDPYFHYHKPWFGLEPVISNDRYQNAGMEDHFEYDSIIVGSSLSQNFETQWFDESFDINTLKFTFAGASVEDIRLNVDKAEEANDHSLKYVFCNLETNLLNHPYDEPGEPLPEYLYDDDTFNDVYYLLNKDVLAAALKAVMSNLQHNVEPLSKAYQWYDQAEFSKEQVLKSIELPDEFESVMQEDAEVSENSIKAVSVLTTLAEKYPQTEFYYFYSPVSIAVWYMNYSEGILFSEIAKLEYSMQQLLQYDNVHLYFPSTYEIITNLNNYKDDIHYSMEIQRLVFEEMRDRKNQITKDNYQKYIWDFRDMILSCDFETIFESGEK